MLYRRKTSKDLSLDLSPLIDVVFLLLIFFMVSTRFKDDHGLDLALPNSESIQSEREDRLMILIDKNQTILLGEQPVAAGSLKNEIRKRLLEFENKNVVLKVDQSVSHGMVVEVMDAAKSAGADGLTFATAAKPKQSDGNP